MHLLPHLRAHLPGCARHGDLSDSTPSPTPSWPLRSRCSSSPWWTSRLAITGILARCWPPMPASFSRSGSASPSSPGSGGRRAELRDPAAPAEEAARQSGTAWGTPATIAIALILALAVPAVHLYGLLLLVLEPWLTRYVRRWYARRQADSRREPSGPELGKIASNEPQKPDGA